MKYIASCSFGKDSIGAIITRIEHGEPIDEILYCRIMFDKNTSAELPEHEEWIHSYAIPKLEKDYGLKTTIVQSEKTYVDYFYSQYQRGQRVGRIYGFPFMLGAWCNDRLKMRPINKYAKEIGSHQMIVGIASDEHKRIKNGTVQNKILPLVEHGVTEAEAFEICERVGLLSPAYKDGCTRLGCWFCHNQRVGELRRLRNSYPALWSKLLEIDKDSPVTFKPSKTLLQFEDGFSKE